MPAIIVLQVLIILILSVGIVIGIFTVPMMHSPRELWAIELLRSSHKAVRRKIASRNNKISTGKGSQRAIASGWWLGLNMCVNCRR